MSTKEPSANARKEKGGRFRIRYLITALIVAVFLIFGAVSLLLLFGSQNRLAKKTKSEMIKTMCQDASSSVRAMVPFLQPLFMQKSTTTPGDISKFVAKELTGGQIAIDAELKKLVDQKLLGMKDIMIISRADSTYTPGLMVLISSDENLVYKWKVPVDVATAMDKGTSYIYMPEGIPELGIAKDGLFVIEPLIDPGSTTKYSNVVVMAKSIQKEVNDINALVRNEERKTTLMFSLVIVGCLLAVIAITYFILSYLIRTRITEPIDTLALTAEEVMAGDLDVDIEVHKGGDFESLERAFKGMVSGIRMMIEKSTEGDK